MDSRLQRGIAVMYWTMRVPLVIAGGYWLSASCVSLLGALFAGMGMARSEAVFLAAMLGFILYMGILLWGSVEPRLERVALLIGGATLVCQGLLRYGLLPGLFVG